MIVIDIGAGSTTEFLFCRLRVRRVASKAFLLFDCLGIINDISAGGAAYFSFMSYRLSPKVMHRSLNDVGTESAIMNFIILQLKRVNET